MFREQNGAIPLDSRRMVRDRLAPQISQLPPDNPRRVQVQLTVRQQSARLTQTGSNSCNSNTAGSRSCALQVMSSQSHASTSHGTCATQDSHSVEPLWNSCECELLQRRPPGLSTPAASTGPLPNANIPGRHSDSGQGGIALSVSKVVTRAGERSHGGGSGAFVAGCPIWLRSPPSSPPAQGVLSEKSELHVPMLQHEAAAAEEDDGGADMRVEDRAEVPDGPGSAAPPTVNSLSVRDAGNSGTWFMQFLMPRCKPGCAEQMAGGARQQTLPGVWESDV